MTTSLLELPTDQQLRVSVASATDEGGRTGNEDAVFVGELPAVGGTEVPESGYLIAVADGMGGYQRGEVASQMAIEVVREMFAADPGADIALLLKQAFRRANERIYENGQGATPPAMMGTTLVVVATRGKYATIASIGDSRAYLARANQLTQVTKDHSLVADQVASGVMSADEARESPHRNILTHALGHRPKLDPKIPNIFEITLLPEDRMLVCTDGFFDVLPDVDLLNTMLTSEPQSATMQLVKIANERGATDNVTAVVLAVAPNLEAPVAPPAATRQSAISIQIVIAAIAAIIVIAVIVFWLAS